MNAPAKNKAGVIVIFPRRRNHPLTLSEIITGYRVTHSPKGDYKTPLPDDYRRAM